MERSIGGIFKDALDTGLQFAIQERFHEQLTERDEGPTEFANPQTVTQPVTPSQTPTGQPNHNLAGLQLTPLMLALGVGGVVALLVVLIKVLR